MSKRNTTIKSEKSGKHESTNFSTQKVDTIVDSVGDTNTNIKKKTSNEEQIQSTNYEDEYQSRLRKSIDTTLYDQTKMNQDSYGNDNIPIIDMTGHKIKYEMLEEIEHYQSQSPDCVENINGKDLMDFSDGDEILTHESAKESDDRKHATIIQIQQPECYVQEIEHELPIEKKVANKNEVMNTKSTHTDTSVPNISSTKVQNVLSQSTYDDKKQEDIMWTTDKETDDLQTGDKSARYTGYIFEIIGETTTSKHNKKVFHAILQNNSKTWTQITAWEDNIPKLKAISDIGNIINCKYLYVHDESDSSDYNFGDPDIILRVEFCTKLNLIEKMNVELPLKRPITDVNFCDILETRGKIRISGYVKNNFRIDKFKILTGSITNGEKVIEINLDSGRNIENIQKGTKITVVGKVERRKDEPIHYIQVTSSDDITITKDKTNLLTSMNGVEHL
ncbi:hypothetical protein QAD02_020549 [Eretmocerus hayati]|uniref:Uncharacterized protein n=1 Tax=Eretmocerus hayati TaxID=131215 RepID=A0ACC2PMQ1_9HYME|nr:hypothetical protein QAD02_020549 [Eretmocerus hayati]